MFDKSFAFFPSLYTKSFTDLLSLQLPHCLFFEEQRLKRYPFYWYLLFKSLHSWTCRINWVVKFTGCHPWGQNEESMLGLFNSQLYTDGTLFNIKMFPEGLHLPCIQKQHRKQFFLVRFLLFFWKFFISFTSMGIGVCVCACCVCAHLK